MASSYLSLSEEQWQKKLEDMGNLEKSCVLCPRNCKVDREIKRGICKAPKQLTVSSTNLHYGEEPPITGSGGSGTVFVTFCNLRCIFCQNFPISQLGNGKPLSDEELAKKMVALQKRGAHNINFVSPTHYTAAILRAIYHAHKMGLTIPIVWNSNAYESVETLKILEGVVDIYLPDIKYSDDNQAKRLSMAPNYWLHSKKAISEMFRQVGHLEVDEEGIATRGLLIRHLVLPNDNSGTRVVLEFIAKEISKYTNISLMAQYFPAHKAHETNDMNRPITEEEYNTALNYIDELGLENVFTQEAEFRFC